MTLTTVGNPSRLGFIFLSFGNNTTFHGLRRLPRAVKDIYSLSLTRTTQTLGTLRTRLAHHRGLSTSLRMSSVSSVHSTPPQLIIIVSRFRTLGSRLPSCVPHLIHVTSLNHSLNVRLVTYARGPLNRIDASVGTGVTVDVYLHIQSKLRSARLLNSSETTAVDPTLPNTTCYGSNRRIATFEYTPTSGVSMCYQRVTFTTRFIKAHSQPSLFASPLPQDIRSRPMSKRISHVQFNLSSGNVALASTIIPLSYNGVTVVKPRKQNGAALLRIVTHRMDTVSNLVLRVDNLCENRQLAAARRHPQLDTTSAHVTPTPPHLV